MTLVVRAHVAIRSKSLPSATSGHAYRARIAVRGGVPALRWTLARGSLPRGLKLAARTGTIAGKPARSGTFRITVRVRDSLGAASTQKLVLRVR